MSVNSRLRWLPRHGIAGLAVRTAARRGNLDARLIRDPAVIADPYQTLDAIRAEGRLAKGPLGLATAHHDVCSEVLRSDAFGVRLRTERLPALLRPLFWYVDRTQTYSPIEPPSMLAVDPPDHTRYRRLVTRVFTARAIEKLRELAGKPKTAVPIHDYDKEIVGIIRDRFASELRSGLQDPDKASREAGLTILINGVVEKLKEEQLPYVRDAILKERLAHWRTTLSAQAL